MNKTVPAGAAHLLNLIRSVEAPRGYNTIFANRQSELPKPVTSMTVDEMIAGKSMVDRRSSATGAYQVMRNTMRSLKTQLHLSGDEVLTPDFQDRLAYELLKRRGYFDFLIGRKSLAEFGKSLAQEWASFPVLADGQGAHRWVKRGQSYYAGDGLNNSLLKPETVEAALKFALAADKSKPGVAPAKEPAMPTSPTFPSTPLPTVVAPDRSTARHAIPWFKSVVTLGAGSGLGASLLAIMSAYQPGVPFANQLTTLWPLFVATAGTASALISRIGSDAQPLTMSQGKADEITVARTAPVVAVETEAPLPQLALPAPMMPEAWELPHSLSSSLEAPVAQLLAMMLGLPPGVRAAIPALVQVVDKIKAATGEEPTQD